MNLKIFEEIGCSGEQPIFFVRRKGYQIIYIIRYQKYIFRDTQDLVEFIRLL